MSLLYNYPKPYDFIKNEIKSLEKIVTRGLLRSYSELNNSLEVLYYEYNALLKKGVEFDFMLHSSLKMEIEKHPHTVIIGANVTRDFSMCSYFLGIVGKGPDQSNLIRKFHFDFAIPTTATNQKVPLFHMQYGGKLSPATGQMGITGNKLDGWLSLPRLNYSPMNIALLLDIMLCEFRTASTHAIVQNSDWRSLIHDNERLLFSSYFENIAAHIKSSKFNKDMLVRDLCYGDC